MSQSGSFEIYVYADGAPISTHQFTAREVTIGRGEGVDVLLNDPSVSTKHAVVHFTGRSCLIEDLRSRNGVRVGGKKVQSYMVQPADEIVVGKFTLLFFVKVAAEQPREQSIVMRIDATVPGLTALDSDMTTLERKSALDAHSQEWVEESRTTAEPSPLFSKPGTQDTVPLVVGKVEPVPKGLFGQERQVRKTKTGRVSTEHAPQGERAFRGERASAIEPSARPRGAVEIAEGPPLVGTAHLGRSRPSSDVISAHDMAEPHPLTLGDEGVADEDDEPFTPSFSLLELLKAPSRPGPVVEVIRSRGDFVEGLDHLHVGQRLKLEGFSRSLCRYRREGEVVFQLKDPARARIVGDSAAAQPVSGKVTLPAGQTAEIDLGDQRQLNVRFVAKVVIPSAPLSGPTFTRQGMVTAASSVLLHVLVFALVAFMPSEKPDDLETNEGRFAKIADKDLELQAKPPEPPKPKEEPVPTPEPQPEALPTPEKIVRRPPPTAHPRAVVHASRSAMVGASAGPPSPKPSATASKLLGALGGLPSTSVSSATAMTNLDAVTTTRSSGGFKSSGAIGKVPGGELRLAAGGSGVGRIDTKGANEVMRGGKLGRVEGGGGGNGHIRGIVERAPERQVQVQGQLDRSEIQKVINAHMREVQGCYERKLIKDPGLAGKIQYEWVVTPAGTVGVVRVKFSSVRDTEVATCIQASMKSWKFPEPKGGAVTVIYPFVFSTIGM